MAETEFKKGDQVRLRLHGDEKIYTGVMLKPRKLWVQLLDYGKPFIADESNIVWIEPRLGG